MAEIALLQWVGFALAALAFIGNDALQTLGTFIASNRNRIPVYLQLIFI